MLGIICAEEKPPKPQLKNVDVVRYIRLNNSGRALNSRFSLIQNYRGEHPGARRQIMLTVRSDGSPIAGWRLSDGADNAVVTFWV
jgi:hypothetical protein